MEMNNASNPWDRVLELLHGEVTDYQYVTWFKPMKPVMVDSAHMLIVLDDKFTLNVLRQCHYMMIQNAVSIAYGREISIDFATSSEMPISKREKEEETRPVRREDSAAVMLNPKYTFDTFVVGSSNRFAHAASLAVAELPADAYNPLFLYGGVGLGKTHLMHAIGHHILQSNPGARILYITSEAFTNQLIDAIRAQGQQDFRDRFRTVDVLMVDDIQFIAGKTSTQEEFFHTFNALHNSGKQIVISSDRPPKDIATLEERLRSRFEWGLIADIQKPDYETRIAILQNKARLEHIQVDDEVLHYIAEKIETNIRELEGSLTRVNAMAMLSGTSLTLEVAREALDKILPAVQTKTVTPDGIIRTVAEYYKVTEADIVSQKRNREVARARQVAMYLIRETTQMSTTRIGEMFGGRDHSTVMYACDKIQEMAENDAALKRELDELRA